jgi:CubicO group peptidase (beta-lactamase class C family)
MSHAQGLATDRFPGHRVDQIFSQFNNHGPGCAIALIEHGKIIYARGYGMADLDHDIAITPSTVFQAASLAKQFTAMALMLLVERDKLLTLDDDVSRHISELRFTRPVSIRQMLTHMSGIRDQYALITMAGWHLYDDLVTRDHLMRLTKRVKSLDFDPQTDFIYSSSGYTIAGLIIEKLGGKSLSNFVHDNIFSPLGMRNTLVVEKHGQIVRNRAIGYSGPNKHNQFEIFMPNLDLVGPTNLHTTVEDLALWVRNFDEKKVGGEIVLSQMQKRAKLLGGAERDYGLGLELKKHRGLNTVEHDGRHAGYRSHLLIFRDNHFAVACLCNLALPDDSLPYHFARRAADVYLEARAHKMSPAEPPAAQSPTIAARTPTRSDLSIYEGRYYSPEIEATYEIERRGASLWLKRPRYDAIQLLARDQDSFEALDFSQPLTSGMLRFTLSNQKVDGFLFDGYRQMQRRILGLRFDRTR